MLLLNETQKHFNELFPPFQDPSAFVLAQAALFTILREQMSPLINASTTWTSLISRRFGGDKYRRTITFRSEESDSTATVEVVPTAAGIYDVEVRTMGGSERFPSVPAQLLNDQTISTTLENARYETTIVSQPAGISDSRVKERLHVFNGGHKVALVIPCPDWLVSLEGGSTATRDTLKAPMPSLVVDVKVEIGDYVEKDQAVVIIESMKTESVLRAHTAGVVKAIGCRNGEMVEEGRELVEIDTGNLEP
jgi:3-methylcrotonyl-CoA carboxylase alpha subunit